MSWRYSRYNVYDASWVTIQCVVGASRSGFGPQCACWFSSQREYLSPGLIICHIYPVYVWTGTFKYVGPDDTWNLSWDWLALFLQANVQLYWDVIWRANWLNHVIDGVLLNYLWSPGIVYILMKSVRSPTGVYLEFKQIIWQCTVTATLRGPDGLHQTAWLSVTTSTGLQMEVDFHWYSRITAFTICTHTSWFCHS